MIAKRGRVSFVSCVVLALLISALWCPKPASAQEADAGPWRTPKTVDSAFLEADAFIEQGRLVDAALLYVQVLDDFPNSPEAQRAFECARRIDKLANANPAELGDVVDALYSRLPRPEEMSSTLARYIVNTLYYLRTQYLRNTFQYEKVAEAQEECIATAFHIMELDPHSPYHIGTAGICVEASKRLHDDKGQAGAEALEAFLEGKSVTMASWACRTRLVNYYLHEGRNRQAAEKHLVQITSDDAQKIVEGALAQPHLMDWAKAMIVWEQGYALLEVGKYDHAVACFDQISEKWERVEAPGQWGGWPAQWAELATPIAVSRKYRDDPRQGIQAYQKFLADHPDNKYVDFARLDLGRLHSRVGDHEQAKTCFREVSFNGSHKEAVEAAIKEIRRVDKMLQAQQE